MWGIVGQEQAVGALDRALREGRLSHAYLFSGPPQVGKATAARRLAQALNCQAQEKPCLRCRACLLIEEGRHPDIEMVGVGGLCEESDHKDHRTDASKDIRICQVRRLERLLNLSPFEGERRIAIVDPADALNVEAANAFLKTLEEPPAGVVLVLVTAREEALPPTVRSRCRRLPFAPLPVRAVERALIDKWSVEGDRARLLARLSGGRLGWAVTAVEDESLLSGREADLDEVLSLSEATLEERFALAGRLAFRFQRDRDSALASLDLWREWWRDVLLVQAGQSEGVTNAHRLDKLSLEARQYEQRAVVRFLEDIGRTRQQLQDNVNPVLALEVLMLAHPAPAGRKETTAPLPGARRVGG